MGSLRPLTDVLRGCADAPRDQPALTMRDVRLSFGGVQALRGVSLSVGPDELFAVIGPNGAGKTSLLNCVSTVYRPQDGEIEVLGQLVTRSQPVEVARRGLARMFQNIALFDTLTVLDNVLLGRHVHVRYGTLAALVRIGPARREERHHRAVAEEVIEFLELERYRKLPVGSLPLGIKKRVELARALASEPKLLLLDEPVAGMNLEETEDMARYIVDVRRELGIPMILIEHDMGLVMRLADRVLVLDFGEVIACDAPAIVQQHPAVARAYLGEIELPTAGSASHPGVTS